ncbi:MAG: hypothetical protein HOM14_01980 [Gammaproteobacteria bacterium]|jgi:hypothetical protein|nr:hypothetical protein [Gammaproteobacteria bacterium]MBT3725020.1 hypothetical protein [Gammaproteobacteria bacterium]MBT4075083.1 hypothetical protein [Gammaproteobacteria bacterium]MBT4193856.1 hypothetical protein [Gammaproteobacteria bacterium]MBT4449731.1 hypothetical protein [Gammaproteobacteria bacterium]
MNNNDHEARLIALVEENKDQECQKLMQNAQSYCQEMLKTEYSNAQDQVHRAVLTERDRAISMIHSAEAELHTRQRANNQQIVQSLLKVGWGYLEKALIDKWQQAKGRRSWIKKCAREALIRLPASDNWVVQHPSDTSSDDLTLFKKIISEKFPDTRCEMTCCDIQAGLVMSAGKTFLDMSLAGLLQDRQNIEGRMLALLHKVGEQ